MKLSFRSGIWVCYWAALFISGCSSRSALTTELTAALTAAEVRWKQSGLSDYSFEIYPFAPLTFGQNAATIEVRGGVVKIVTRLGSLEPPRATVDDLLASIRVGSRSSVRFALPTARLYPNDPAPGPRGQTIIAQLASMPAKIWKRDHRSIRPIFWIISSS
jgi:hypothetical protein